MSDKIIETLDALQKSLDEKGVKTQQSINKQNAIIEDLGVQYQKSQDEASQIKQGQQEAAKTLAEVKTVVDNLTKSNNRLGLNGQSERDVKSLKSAFDTYARCGEQVPSELVERVTKSLVNAYVQSNDDKVISGLVSKMVGEQGEKGYILPEFIAKGMQVGINADGGFLVEPEFRNDIVVNRVFETSPMRLVSNVVTTSEGSIDFIIDDDEAAAGWVNEKDDRPETATAKIGKKTIQAMEIYAEPKVTQRMLQDAGFDVIGFINNKTNRKISRVENTAFVSGNGSEKPKGFLDYAGWDTNGVYQRGALEHVTTENSGVISSDDLITLSQTLIEDYQSNAVFMMKRATWGQIIKSKTGSGDYLFNMSRMMSDSTTNMLLGKPVIFADDMQAIASNSLSVAYGDFNEGYTIVDKPGIYLLRDPYTSKAHVKFYTSKRVGGDVTSFESIKVLKTKA